jgi:hypothetical protein
MGWTAGALEGPFTSRAAITFDLGEEFAERVIATVRYGTVIYAAVRSADGREVFGLVLLAERMVDAGLPAARALSAGAAVALGRASRRGGDASRSWHGFAVHRVRRSPAHEGRAPTPRSPS